MEDNNDDVDRDKDPPDTFSEYSDPESEGGGFPIDWDEVYREIEYRHPGYDEVPPIWQG
ncbi:hypothetical protein HO173_007369 [Letharia columbiana]|uniref:Uncharacterized protein n=1 Tax=Letharia columbiana TaxID=112416 RepID=A0A8H6L3N1_9LECA|nr:uncharacterized protein HO173_007369 [Letharia columbiana]KAF6234336.1 hypothetical protein HO173_007369 [Letharia columbiana]